MAPKISVKEGFSSNVLIRRCPADTKRFINDKGFALCCKGQVESGHCNGETICSLSESAGNIPTCSAWYSAYLVERGTSLCPASAPNYYENLNGTSGCTAGSLTSEGNAPADTSSHSCILYGNTTEDTGKMDSCLNVKYLADSMCFTGDSLAAKKSLVEKDGGKKPALVSCSYGNAQSLDESTGSCFTDESIIRNKIAMIDAKNVATGANASINEWKATSADWDPMYKMNFCSVVQRFKVSGVGSCEDLKTMKVFN